MASPIFTLGDDIIDLNGFDLDFLEAQGVVTNDALSGYDTVTLSETQNIGELFKAGDGRDTVNGSSGGDYISGGAGTDWLRLIPALRDLGHARRTLEALRKVARRCYAPTARLFHEAQFRDLRPCIKVYLPRLQPRWTAPEIS
jgi:hypothetical protein